MAECLKIRVVQKMEMTSPEISVIVPVYKVEPYLERCVQSILSQTFTDFELLLIDDGSPDRCPELCEEFAQNDWRVRVIHQKNQGLSAARNKGIENASGKYLAFIDSDDWIHPEMLERLYTEFLETGAQIVLCNYANVYGEGKREENDFGIKKREILTGREALERVTLENENIPYIIACNKLYKKELFEYVRYPAGKLHEDVFVIYELYLQCEKICCISDVFYFYRQREESIAHSCSMRSLDEAEAYYRMFFKLYELNDTGFLENVEKRLFAKLTVVYESLSADERKSARVKEIKKCWKQMIKILIKEKKCSLRTMVRSSVFYFMPQLYYRIMKSF